MSEKWIDGYLDRNAETIEKIIHNTNDTQVRKDLEYRLFLMDKISNWKKIVNDLSFGMSHGDFHCEQYSVYKDRITVFDFTNCARIPLC